MPDTAAKSLVRDVPSADRGNAAENKAGPSSLEQPAKPSAINDDLRQRKDELLLNIKKEVVALGKDLLAAPICVCTAATLHCRK